MDKNVGSYDNAACIKNDNILHTVVATTAIEMERTNVTGKCCGRGSNQSGSNNELSNSLDANAALNVCQPKCPAIKKSPWDPIKTRFALLLVVAIVLWIIVGVIAIKY